MDFNKIFHKVPVQIQNRSAFNCGHKNLFTGTVGTLMPVLVDPLIPNTTVDLGAAIQVQLPPLATDFYGDIYGKLEVFFVPNRIIWNGWRDFMTLPSDGNFDSYPGIVHSNVVTQLPYLYLDRIDNDEQNLDLVKSLFGAGSLADMLGYKSIPAINEDTAQYEITNMLPFLAYHKIFDDWYRDSRIQSPIFKRPIQGSGSPLNWYHAPWLVSGDSQYLIGDDYSFFELHQRNFQRDYFTNATPLPQAGAASSVSVENGEFTIAALRAANSLQQWYERNNIAGERYSDQIKARFGIYPSDAVTDRAIYLGSKTFQVYSKSVYDTTNLPGQGSPQNPFIGLVGSKASSVSGYGEDSLVSNFTASEHGHLVVMFSLVPEVLYSTGTRRYLTYSTVTDFPDPLLQGVGDQPIYSFEVDNSPIPAVTSTVFDANTFGYTQRYSEAKFMNDEVHGKLKDGENLFAFALQRSFSDTNTEIGNDFLQIPRDYLDQVSNVGLSVSEYGYWCESYFRYNKIMPLAAYSIPTLGDPKDTHTEIIDNGGSRL